MTSGLKKNLSWNTIGMVLYNFAIWFFSVLILRLLGTVESGYYAIAVSIGNTLYALSLFGMRTFIVSDRKHTYSLEEYLSARLLAVLGTFLILVLITLISGYSFQQCLVLGFYSLFKLSEAMIEVLDCFCQQVMEMKVNAQSMVLRAIVYIASFALTLEVTRSSAAGFLVLTALSVLCFLFFNLPRVERLTGLKNRIIFHKKTLQILKECFPIMAFEMLSSLIVAIPKLRYEQIGDLSQLGIYASIYTMVVFLQLVINVFIYTFAPYMAEAHSRNDRKGFLKYTFLLVAGAAGLGVIAELLTAILGYPVMGLLYGAEAAPYYTYLYSGIISGVTLAFTWICSQIFVIYHHNQDQLVCSILSTISCYFLSKALITPSDCNQMTYVLIDANLIFLGCAVILGFYHARHDAGLKHMGKTTYNIESERNRNS